MRARLQRYVNVCTTARFTGATQCHDLGMRFTRALVPAFADDLLPARHDAADARIGLGGVEPAFGKLECARHQTN